MGELQKAVIKDWRIQAVVKDSEILGIKLNGKVYGHPKFADGTEVTTSTVQKIITRNTEYTLE